jgi:predicted nucleotidyltransferase
MAKTVKKSRPVNEPRWYHSPNVPMSVIRRFARQMAERFHPEKIILFGSYAYGHPHEASDVDILVVMSCRNALDEGYRIYSSLEPPFPAQIVVRTPGQMRDWLMDGDSFHVEIAKKGIALYEKGQQGVDRKSRARLSHRRTRSHVTRASA